MKKIILEIETVNEAFFPYVNDEVVRILRDVADRIERNKIPAGIYDINGNRVGDIREVH